MSITNRWASLPESTSLAVPAIFASPLQAGRTSFRRVAGRAVDRDARVAAKVERLDRVGHGSDPQLAFRELHFGAADARRPVGTQGRHGQVLARSHQGAHARGKLRLRRLELRPRRQGA